MKRALIITGGEYAPYEFVQYYLPAYDLLIAADSGLDTALQFGLVPDFVIGDMDGVKDNLFIQACDKTRTHLFPRDKDFTDTELAVTLAHQLGSDDLSIVGGGGGRADHFLYFMRLFAAPLSPRLWLYRHGLGYCFGEGCVTQQLCIGGVDNTSFSFFPVGDATDYSLSSEGLHWPLDGVPWHTHVSMSNRSSAPVVRVEAHRGRFLLFLSPLGRYTIDHHERGIACTHRT